MTARTIATIGLLTAVLCCACASGPPRKDRATADLHCEPRTVGAHCITGEELQRFGARDTAEALRMAFPWIN